jgi:hypothetical protein
MLSNATSGILMRGFEAAGDFGDGDVALGVEFADGHEGFAEADDIAKHDTAALFKVPGRDANRGGLKFEQGVAHVRRDRELGQARPCLFGQVIGHLHVNVVRGRTLGPRPAFVNDLDEFFGDVHTPLVAPAVLEPLFEFLGGVLVEDIHVEFALVGQAGEREVA